MSLFHNHKITPNLWFDNNAKEAMEYYVSVFPNSKVLKERTYHNSGPDGKQDTYVCEFELDGQKFQALNGGPLFKFSEAVSFVVDCKDQAEVDYYWEKLSADPASEQCGWCKDRFGLSWQIVPKQLGEMLDDPDPEKAKRTMHAMLNMHKLDVAGLQKAHDGE
jgi:predicted 3-demethylubiquinone-9 3-methyltransferase (glyoxalase superfamily)